MTHIVDRLEAAGLVERTLDVEDRRSILVGLKGEGRALVDRAGVAHLSSERELLQVLTREEQQRLAALLKKLLLAFEAEGVPPITPRTSSTRHRQRRRRP